LDFFLDIDGVTGVLVEDEENENMLSLDRCDAIGDDDSERGVLDLDESDFGEWDLDESDFGDNDLDEPNESENPVRRFGEGRADLGDSEDDVEFRFVKISL
jgi:hypothetical protein